MAPAYTCMSMISYDYKFYSSQMLEKNQAHTCKTLGVVTKPKSIASTHAQMHPRNIIHERARLAQLISYSRPRPAHLGAGRGSEYENMSSRACHVKHAPCTLQLLSFRASKPFDNSSLLVRFRCLEVDQSCLSIRKLSAGALYRHKDGLGSPLKVFLAITFDPCIFSEFHTF